MKTGAVIWKERCREMYQIVKIILYSGIPTIRYISENIFIEIIISQFIFDYVPKP